MSKKRIIICLDGTWNDPEDEVPTNVLRVARAIKPHANNDTEQVVFYDWGVGSYYASARGGMSGLGMMKNIQDGYRFIVQNYDVGDELFIFGFSRGAYTARALAGMLNNCGILKSKHAELIPDAFKFYKKRSAKPGSNEAAGWRRKYALQGSRGQVDFLGVWDTVGALGIPTRVLAFVEEKDLFYDPVLGSNVVCARHAVSIDEKRSDFTPTLWDNSEARDMKQVWFAGVHADIGGGAKPRQGKFLSDIALAWVAREAANQGLEFASHLHGSTASHHKINLSKSYKSFYRVLGKTTRVMPTGNVVDISVKKRHRASQYRPEPLARWLLANDGWGTIEP